MIARFQNLPIIAKIAVPATIVALVAIGIVVQSERNALQSQSLNFQDFSFHGVSVSIRHCVQRSGGQWLRREVSLTSAAGAITSGIARRLSWRVASPIMSTNSGLSATAGSPCESDDFRKGPVCAAAP
jgi:hypothetical protein